MKTTKHIQKTGKRKFRTATIVLVFASSFFTAYGQAPDTTQHHVKENQLALATTHHSAEELIESANRENYNFKTGTPVKENVEQLSIETEPEASLKVEDWMISNKYFASFSPDIKPDRDEPLTIEHWMIDKQIWKN